MKLLKNKDEKLFKNNSRNMYAIKIAVETGVCASFLACGLLQSSQDMVDNLKIMAFGIISAVGGELALRDLFKYRKGIINEKNELIRRNQELELENQLLKEAQQAYNENQENQETQEVEEVKEVKEDEEQLQQ